MSTARLTQLAGLGPIDGESVLLGRFGVRGSEMNATLQAITDSETLARFAPCIDTRRLSLTVQSIVDADGRTATANFAFSDGFSFDVSATLAESAQQVRLTTSPFALAPCGAVAPEFGLDLTGRLGLALEFNQRGDEAKLTWSSELSDVSLQFHDLLEVPLPVERFRGEFAGTATTGMRGRAELALADLPVYVDAATEAGRQTLGVTTATPLPLLRLARLLSLKQLDRQQRNAVLRQVRRGRIERLWLGSACELGAIGDCLGALGRWETELDGRMRIVDLALTPLPRAPGLTIPAVEARIAQGGLLVTIEDGSGEGFRLTGGSVLLSQASEGGVAAKGEIAFSGPVSDFAAMAREGLGADVASQFEVRAGAVDGSATVDWPQLPESGQPWLAMALRMSSLQGLAGGTVAVDDAGLRAKVRVSGATEEPTIAGTLDSLDARGAGWSISGSGSGNYGSGGTDFTVDARALVTPELLATALPDNHALRWTGGAVMLNVQGTGQGADRASFSLGLDGGEACFDLEGETPVRLKDCAEALTATARFDVKPDGQPFSFSQIKADLAGQPLISDGRIDLLPDGPGGRIETGRIAAAFLTSRLPDDRVTADAGDVAAKIILTDGAWTASADLRQVQLAEPVKAGIDGRVHADAAGARADLVLRPDVSAVPEIRLAGTVRELGPAPVVEASIRIPSVEIPRVESGSTAPDAGSAGASAEPAPILLPELDRFIVGAPDTYIPGRGNVSLRVDSVNLAAGGAAAGHVDGAFAWGRAGQRLTMDWLRDGRVSAALFAEVQQAAAGASALARMRFATSDVDTALISRLLVGRPIAESGSVGMRLDLQGPWQRSLRRWSGFLELRGSDINLTEAQLLAETITASGVGGGSVPGVLGLRRGSVQGRLSEGRVSFESVYLETNVATVFGRLGVSLADNGVEGLAVVGPLKDLQDLFQLLPGLHSVGDAVEALRFAVKIDGTVTEPAFERVGPGGSSGEPEVVRTLQDTLRKLQALGGN